MKKPRGHVIIVIVVGLLLITSLISLYTAILQKNYSNSTVEAAVEWDTRCSDAIHRMMSDELTREDFDTITSTADMHTERYQQLQQKMNRLRSLNSTRYLYTAKRGDDGRLIYLIDGLDLGAEDFAYPGTYIEDEMVPYIEAALSGETIYSQEIVDTTWGHIFTACYPVVASDGTGDIIGALCIEMDMEESYAYIAASNRKAALTVVIASAIFFAIMAFVGLAIRKQRKLEAMQQKELEEAVTAADSANRAKSTFLFNMSHDIRTPMNAILGFAELAERNSDSAEKVHDYLEKIRISGNKMLAILDNVLELSRIESGKIILEETPAEAGSVLDACLVMVQPEMDKKHQHLTVSKEIIYPYTYFDTSRVSEIILNLVSNAIKYTNEGGHIHCSIRQRAGDRVGWFVQQFSVSDDGIGMSEEFQQHIYEAFARERSSTISGIEGTGLGMGIVKKLVDMMDGTIELTSKVGVGSTFTVQIPCRIATYDETQPKQAESSCDTAAFSGKRILLAEDNDLNAEIAVELLSDVGFTVDRVENGVQCIERLEREEDHYYTMILMDIQMPILDGYDTTKKIRRLENVEKANIPIIAMTANAFAEDRQKALDVGMNDHLAKPIDMNKVIPILSKYI